MDKITILWADDEIDLLKPHILFLKEKGYEVIPVMSGTEALDELDEHNNKVDIVFLDEMMPGLSGLETLTQIKARYPQVPVIMITKSEEEHIMDEALGSKISDYLIKPVNPSQILLAIKKHTEARRLQSERSTMTYQQQFREIGMELFRRRKRRPTSSSASITRVIMWTGWSTPPPQPRSRSSPPLCCATSCSPCSKRTARRS